MKAPDTLIALFTQHKVASNLAMIMMVLSGLWAVSQINTQLDPSVEWPYVHVNVNWPGASAEDVEQLVVVPIEQQLRTLDQLVEIYSVSWNGGAYVRAEFDFSSDMTQSLDQVKDRIGQIRNFPADMEPLRISRGTSYEEIAVVAVSSNGTLDELIPVVRQMERELLARGIDRIDFDGMPKEELAIQVSSARLLELNTSLDRIADEVRLRSSDAPAGTVGRGQGARQLRSLEQKRSSAEFEQIEVSLNQNGGLTRLGDIATIEKRPQPEQPWLTRNGKPTIEMSLHRITDSDAIEAADILNTWLDETRPTLPAGMELHVYQEVWVLLKQQLLVIFDNGLSGLLLVVVSLFLFLNGRVGTWVMIGIPVSFLFATLIYFALFDGSINILALITFVMALGIVVDDAIVVGEDAVTLFEQGYSPAEAAAGGAHRMFVPVMTSSLTTMAAFVPLLITGGDLGKFIVTLPTVLLCVILASLAECFLVLPGHLKSSFEKIDPNKPSPFRIWFDTRFTYVRETWYRPVIEWALANPGTTLLTALGCVVLAVSLAASGRVGVKFVTGMSLEMLGANIEFSADASDEDRFRFLEHLESTLNQTDDEFDNANIKGYVVKYNSAFLNQERKRGSQYGSLRVEYAWDEERTISPQEFVNSWRSKVARMPYVEQLHIEVRGGANNGRPDITFILRGQDIPTLKTASEELQAALGSYKGVSNIYDDLPYGRDQLLFSLTPEGKALGLTTVELGRQLRAAYQGRRVQIFNLNEIEMEVLVTLPDAERNQIGFLQQLPVRTPAGDLVALGLVADLSSRRGIDVINHNNGFMSVAVSASVDSEVNNAQQIMGNLEENALADIRNKYGLSSDLGGVSRRNQEIVQTMALGSVLTLIFIYLILAWSFASYTWPLAVMTAIPLGITGAIFGHWVMDFDIGAMSLLAFFSLTGIVVNDSIVLISFFRRNLAEGMSVFDAVRDASLSRFRAVLLTSLTTIAGLTPLMFETFSLAMYMVPIAITLCFGLAFATVLVLIVVPALVILIENAAAWLRQFRDSGRGHMIGEQTHE
ncbi:MAG: efflux RND transporter permease subunit [Pseudomonadales bacterium]|nr:efflux RND transporter permease subunit [Pseudomonadales bacterium]